MWKEKREGNVWAGKMGRAHKYLEIGSKKLKELVKKKMKGRRRGSGKGIE